MTTTTEPTLTVTLPRRTLHRALQLLEPAVAHASQRATMPILGCVLVEAEPEALRLTASNLAQTLALQLPVPCGGTGRVAVPAALLGDLVGALPDGELALTLSPEDRTLEIRAGRYQARIRGMDATDFPRLLPTDAEPVARVAASVLARAIGQVIPAVARDEIRGALAGVQLLVETETLTLAGADGFRAALRTMPLLETAPRAEKAVVPARTMALLTRVLAETEEPVEIALPPDQEPADGEPPSWVLFRAGQATLRSAVIDQPYPQIRRIIPPDPPTRVRVPVEELLRAVRVARPFSASNSQIVRLAATPGEDGGRLELLAESAELGDQRTELVAEIEGEGVRLALNVAYLQDALAALETGTAVMGITSPTVAVVLRPAAADTDHLHLIMPMHVA